MLLVPGESSIVSSALLTLFVVFCLPSGCLGVAVVGNVVQNQRCAAAWSTTQSEWNAAADAFDRAGDYQTAGEIRGQLAYADLAALGSRVGWLLRFYMDPRSLNVVRSSAADAARDADVQCARARSGTFGWTFAGAVFSVLTAIFIAIDGLRNRIPAWYWSAIFGLFAWPVALGLYLYARHATMQTRARERAAAATPPS